MTAQMDLTKAFNYELYQYSRCLKTRLVWYLYSSKVSSFETNVFWAHAQKQDKKSGFQTMANEKMGQLSAEIYKLSYFRDVTKSKIKLNKGKQKTYLSS